MVHTDVADISPGGSSEVAPPVPIPNTAVKRFSAYDTALVTEWENRSPPGVYRQRTLPSCTFPVYGSVNPTNRPFPLSSSESSA